MASVVFTPKVSVRTCAARRAAPVRLRTGAGRGRVRGLGAQRPGGAGVRQLGGSGRAVVGARPGAPMPVRARQG